MPQFRLSADCGRVQYRIARTLMTTGDELGCRDARLPLVNTNGTETRLFTSEGVDAG